MIIPHNVKQIVYTVAAHFTWKYGAKNSKQKQAKLVVKLIQLALIPSYKGYVISALIS